MYNDISKKEKQDVQLPRYIFRAASIGAVFGAIIGLLAYIKDWI